MTPGVRIPQLLTGWGSFGEHGHKSAREIIPSGAVQAIIPATTSPSVSADIRLLTADQGRSHSVTRFRSACRRPCRI